MSGADKEALFRTIHVFALDFQNISEKDYQN